MAEIDNFMNDSAISASLLQCNKIITISLLLPVHNEASDKITLYHLQQLCDMMNHKNKYINKIFISVKQLHLSLSL